MDAEERKARKAAQKAANDGVEDKSAEEKAQEQVQEEPVRETPTQETAPQEAAPLEVSPEEERIAALEAEVAQLKDQLLRALAETENLRRRSQREKEEALKYAPAPLAKALLPVADNLRRALDSVPEDLRGDERAQALLSGLDLTAKELLQAFARNNIELIEPQGEKLDPHWHEALFEVPDDKAEPGSVVQVVEVGYRLGDRLLRPARVGVARKPG